MPHSITIIEVGTRDGIQAQPRAVTTEEKLQMLEYIVAAGFRRIEVTSFVHPKHVPQMADAEEVLSRMPRREGLEVEALVPNVRGMERALKCKIDTATLFVAASESFNQKNLRASQVAMLKAGADAARMGLAEGLKLRGGVVTAFGCPYEGQVSFEAVDRVVDAYLEMGCAEVNLADTTGMTNPAAVTRMIEHISKKFPSAKLGLHFHNTRGQGLANVLAGVQAGVNKFDASLGGLGGCPFAPRATGNIATEDTVNMLHEMGYKTGVDLRKLLDGVAYAEQVLGRQLPGQLLHAGIVNWEAGTA